MNSFNNYAPRNFARAFSQWGADLGSFLTEPSTIADLEHASDAQKPAAQVLAVPLLARFGEQARGFRFRQLVGHMLKHLMTSRGWVVDQVEVRIRGGALFTRAARYRRAGAALLNGS